MHDHDGPTATIRYAAVAGLTTVPDEDRPHVHRDGNVSTLCRTHTSGKTSSTRCAARSTMRRPPPLDRARGGPEHRRRAASQIVLERALGKPRQTVPIARLYDVRAKRRVVIAHNLVQAPSSG